MKQALTSADLLERMAYNSGRSIEIVGNAAYLVVGDIVWTAKLAPTHDSITRDRVAQIAAEAEVVS